jgi:membrane-associated phospholipid phosphatase
MVELSIEKMEMVSGGGTPSGHSVTCFVLSGIYGFIAPPLGLISGFVCLFID